MNNERFYLNRIEILANQVRCMGDLLLCVGNKTLDLEKLGFLGLLIVKKIDKIKTCKRKLSQVLSHRTRKAKEGGQEQKI